MDLFLQLLVIHVFEVVLGICPIKEMLLGLYPRLSLNQVREGLPRIFDFVLKVLLLIFHILLFSFKIHELCLLILLFRFQLRNFLVVLYY